MGIKRFTINEFRIAYPNDNACLDRVFQLRYSNLVCPKCESDKPFSRVKDRRSYQCSSCGFQIYPTQGTVFEKSTTPLTHWFYAIFLQTTTRNGVAAKELERQLDVCYKTALRMAHQIKKLMADDKDEKIFSGVIEADETLIGGLNKNRHADKKVPNIQGRSTKDKTAVFGMVERGSKKVSAHVVKDTSGETLKEKLDAHVDKKKSIVVTDEWLGYSQLSREYLHVTLNHKEDEYVRGAFHTNTIEGFWSQLKRTIKGTHIHVSDRHLQKYVDEVAFRYEHRERQDKMFETILSHVV